MKKNQQRHRHPQRNLEFSITNLCGSSGVCSSTGKVCKTVPSMKSGSVSSPFCRRVAKREIRLRLHEKEVEVEKLSKQLEEINNNNVAKIDRYLVKNLIVGYFTTPTDKRTEVLRVIATVLDFNREDRQKTGLESTSMWPFGRGAAGGDAASDLARQQSFTETFIKFLESESQPKTQFKIPLEEMTRRNSKTNVSGSSTPVLGASGDASTSTRHSSTSSAVGMSEMSVNLPVLNQADRSNSILKDVLNPR